MYINVKIKSILRLMKKEDQAVYLHNSKVFSSELGILQIDIALISILC